MKKIGRPVDRGDLSIHVRIMRLNLKEHKCDQCGTFATLSDTIALFSVQFLNYGPISGKDYRAGTL